MASKFKTITAYQYHSKVLHNLTQLHCEELAKTIKKHYKVAENLRKRMISKRWCIS